MYIACVLRVDDVHGGLLRRDARIVLRVAFLSCAHHIWKLLVHPMRKYAGDAWNGKERCA